MIVSTNSVDEMFMKQQQLIQQRVAYFGTLTAPPVPRQISWEAYLRDRARFEQAASRVNKFQKNE